MGSPALEVVLIGAVVHVHLCIKGIFAGVALLPGPGVPFVVMRSTQSIAVMIAKTAVAGIGKQPIGMGIVTNPLPAAGSFRQLTTPTTQPALCLAPRVAWLVLGCFGMRRLWRRGYPGGTE